MQGISVFSIIKSLFRGFVFMLALASGVWYQKTSGLLAENANVLVNTSVLGYVTALAAPILVLAGLAVIMTYFPTSFSLASFITKMILRLIALMIGFASGVWGQFAYKLAPDEGQLFTPAVMAYGAAICMIVLALAALAVLMAYQGPRTMRHLTTAALGVAAGYPLRQ